MPVERLSRRLAGAEERLLQIADARWTIVEPLPGIAVLTEILFPGADGARGALLRTGGCSSLLLKNRSHRRVRQSAAIHKFNQLFPAEGHGHLIFHSCFSFSRRISVNLQRGPHRPWMPF